MRMLTASIYDIVSFWSNQRGVDENQRVLQCAEALNENRQFGCVVMPEQHDCAVSVIQIWKQLEIRASAVSDELLDGWELAVQNFLEKCGGLVVEVPHAR